MQSPPLVWLNFDFSFLLVLAGDVSLNPGPGVRGLHAGTVNVRSMWDMAPALSDLVTSNGIDLLEITETRLTMRKTSADLAEMTPLGFSFFRERRAQWRGVGVGLFI